MSHGTSPSRLRLLGRLTLQGALLLAVLLVPRAQAQTGLKFLDAPSIAGHGTGWKVHPATGALQFQVDLAQVPGAIPIPVTLRMQGSPALLPGFSERYFTYINGVYVPEESQPGYVCTYQDPETGWSYDVVCSTGERIWEWRTETIRDFRWDYHPIQGVVHFGGMSPRQAGGWQADWVLENGRVLPDWTAGKPAGTIFPLPQQFGMNVTVLMENVSVTPDGSMAVLSCAKSSLGTLGSKITWPVGWPPPGWGSDSVYILMDSNLVRVYATVGDRTLPVLIADRFGHHVAFAWERKTTGIQPSLVAIESAILTNEKGLGLQVQWAIPTQGPYSDWLMRLDYVGFSAPSMVVKGQVGVASALPSAFTQAVGSTPMILRERFLGLGPTFRPTEIVVDEPQDAPQPTWLPYGKPLPSPMAAYGQQATSTPASRKLTWNISYVDGAMATEIADITTPMGTITQFTPETVRIYTVSDTPDTAAHLRGVQSAITTDLLQAAKPQRIQTWKRVLPRREHGTPAETWPQETSDWYVDQTDYFKKNQSDPTPSSLVYQRLSFARPTSPRDYSNAASTGMSLYDKDPATTSGGSWLTQTTQSLTAGGYDGSLSMVQYSSQASTVGGLLSQTTSTTMDWEGMKVLSQEVIVGEAQQKTTYESQARPELLIPDQTLSATTSRAWLSVPGTYYTLAPETLIQKFQYDQTTGLPTTSYRDGGSVGTLGTTTTLGSDGRPSSVKPFGTAASLGYAQAAYSYAPAPSPHDPKGETWTRTLQNAQGGSLLSETTLLDPKGQVREQTDARGVKTTFTYDIWGRLIQETKAGEGSISYAYPDERTRTKTWNSQTWIQKVDGFGQVIQEVTPEEQAPNGAPVNGVVREYTYDAHGRVSNVTETNAVGKQRASAMGYDALGRITSRTSPTGVVETYTYTTETDAAGLSLSVTTTTRPGSVTSEVRKNGFGQVVSETAPDGTLTSYTYDGQGNLLSVVQKSATGLTQARTFKYDALGRMTEKTAPETGNQTFSAFTLQGQPTVIKEAAGTADERIRTLTVDDLGRIKKVISGNGTLEFTFTGADLTLATRTIGADTVTQRFEYESYGARRLKLESTQVGAASPLILTYEYNTLGQVQFLTYPSGRVVEYGYDAQGRPKGVKTKGATQDLTTLSRNEWGVPSALTFGSGAQSGWTYKSDLGLQTSNWVIGFTGGTPESQSYQYDAADRLTQAGEWTLEHDALSRLKVANGSGLSTTHGHDAFGNNTSHRVVPGASPMPSTMANWDFAPMEQNRMPARTAPAPLGTNALTGWAYNHRGEATSFGSNVGNVPALAVQWDALGLASKVSSSALGLSQTYLYAPSGLRVAIMDTDPSLGRRFAYTSGGLLLSEFSRVVQSVHSGQKAVRVPHRPDQFSAIAKHLGTFSAGEVVRATVWFKAPSGVHGEMFLGDAGGADPYDNATYTAVMGNGDWQQITLTWTMTHADSMWIYLYSDQWGVPDYTKVPTHPGTVYDDVLVTGSFQGTVLNEGFEGGDIGSTGWGWGVDGVFQEVVGQEDPGLWRRDVIYLGGSAVAEIDANGVHELHSDHLGTPRVVTKGSDGTIEARQSYGPYGERITTSATYAPLTGYTGHVQTDATGLIYMRGRYYSPTWHRFLNSDQGVDPNSWNQMAYVGGSPFMATDPSGMTWVGGTLGCLGFYWSSSGGWIDSWGEKGLELHWSDSGGWVFYDACWGAGGGGGSGGDGGGSGGGNSVAVQPQTPKDKNPCDDPTLRKFWNNIASKWQGEYNYGNNIGTELGGWLSTSGFYDQDYISWGRLGGMSVPVPDMGTELGYHFHPNRVPLGASRAEKQRSLMNGRFGNGNLPPSDTDYKTARAYPYIPQYVFSSSGAYLMSDPNGNKFTQVAGSNWWKIRCQ